MIWSVIIGAAADGYRQSVGSVVSQHQKAVSYTHLDVYKRQLYQLGALDAFCRVTGVKMQHVKPHGALYNLSLIHI